MPLLPPGPSMIIVGTKPARPHFLSDQLRLEIWSDGAGNKMPVMRLRNEQCGSICLLSHEELSKHREAVDGILQILESEAGAQAKGALDDIVKSFDPTKFKPEEGGPNA